MVIPIRPDTHGHLGWSPVTGFSFARGLTVLPLATWEIARAAQAMPVVFERQNGRWQTVAIMGASDGTNAYVALDGRWCSHYLPVMFRLYPFCTDVNGNLCLDDSFTPEHKDRTGVIPFFRDGELSARLKQTQRFLSVRARGIRAVSKALNLLAAKGALLPYNRNVGINLPQQDLISESFVLDAERLADIDDASVTTLFRSGALRWLHAHLDSLHHLDCVDRREKVVIAANMNVVEDKVFLSAVAEVVAAIVEDAGDADLWLPDTGLHQ